MSDKEYYENLLYLNSERIKVSTGKERFVGVKVLKYFSLIKRLRFVRIFKELNHDIYAFLKKDVSNNHIIDFSQNAVSVFQQKVVVYTSIFGGYDKILEPLCVDENCEYYIFTDQNVPETSIWKKVDASLIPDYCDTPAKKNRYVKMFPHKLFDCLYSIYIDGNLQLVGHPSQLIQKKLNECKTGIGMHLAPRENCIYEEAKNVCHVGKISKSEKKQVLTLYKNSKMPRHFGMCECNVIVRNHNNVNMKQLMEKWWKYYLEGVKRDQLYFTYTVYTSGFKFTDINTFGASVNNNVHFFRTEHAKR